MSETFYLSCTVTVSAYTNIEADTLEEAIKLSKERPVVIGGIGSGNDSVDYWIIDDADGSPENIVSGV